MSPDAPIESDCVVDASTEVKLLVGEEHSDRARALFESMAGDSPSQLHVPGLFYHECANVLWKHVRRGGTPVEQALRCVRDLLALPLTVHPATELVARSIELGSTYDIAAYDASYVVLAHMLGLPLVAADERLGRKLTGSPIHLVWLGDWQPEVL